MQLALKVRLASQVLQVLLVRTVPYPVRLVLKVRLASPVLQVLLVPIVRCLVLKVR